MGYHSEFHVAIRGGLQLYTMDHEVVPRKGIASPFTLPGPGIPVCREPREMQWGSAGREGQPIARQELPAHYV